jgi:hypothetical protein
LFCLLLNYYYRAYDEKIKLYNGDDPLEPWVEFIHFLENSNLRVAKHQAKMRELIRDGVKTFYKDPKYKNDKRYLELLIKVVCKIDS